VGALSPQAGTNHQINSIDSPVNAARIQNIGRQPVKGMSHCTGSVEASNPSEPVMSIQELARSCASLLSQRR
jgi:hypothetical protein